MFFWLFFFSLSRCCAVCVQCIILPVESWEPPIKSQPERERKGERNHQSGAATPLVRRCSINHAGARQERRKLREGPAESQTARSDAASRLSAHRRPIVSL